MARTGQRRVDHRLGHSSEVGIECVQFEQAIRTRSKTGPGHGLGTARERGLRRVGTTTRRTATAAAAGALLLEAGYAHVLPSISQPTSDAVEHSSRNPPQSPANAPASWPLRQWP
ncbi:hypothetical protein GCM10022206_13130 [Streptomyces chiangmaiensis]